VLRLDLKRGRVVLDDGGSLEAAGLFVKYVHSVEFRRCVAAVPQ
jgi:hypothetical protein